MIIDPMIFVNLVHTFGYFGVFISSLIGSASIVLPVPSFLFVVAAGTILNPLAVGIIAGIGSAVGELTGYFIGVGLHYGKHKITKKKKEGRWEKMVKKCFGKSRGFVAIALFAVTPLPDDVIGIFCGFIRYDIKKYFIAVLIGKTILCIVLAYSGYYGWNLISQYFV